MLVHCMEAVDFQAGALMPCASCSICCSPLLSLMQAKLPGALGTNAALRRAAGCLASAVTCSSVHCGCGELRQTYCYYAGLARLPWSPGHVILQP